MSRCVQCKKYGVLHKPWRISDTIFVYGFCFKDIHENYGSAYPVYSPDGACKAFDKKKEEKSDHEHEMEQEFMCCCCKKNLISKITKCIEKSK